VELYNPKRTYSLSNKVTKINNSYFSIFPVGNTWWNLPVLLFFYSKFTCRWMKNWNWRTWTHLNRGGSIGSFWTSTIWMIRCLALELKAGSCCDGV
jgi:hypothetical protein